VDDQQVFTQAEAAAFLRFKDARWLDDAPIAWCDARKPGNTRPVRRYLREVLLAFLRGRQVEPGAVNLMEQ
jgi:hypothetical protein